MFVETSRVELRETKQAKLFLLPSVWGDIFYCCRGGMDVLSLDQEVGAWDSVLLDPLTEDSFIANLHQRFKRDHIYVSGSSFILSWLWGPHPSC